MNVIGLDIGTTTICGIAVDAESGKLLKSVTQIGIRITQAIE